MLLTLFFEELLAGIRARTRRQENILKKKLEAADLTLDTKLYEVKRGKTPISLSGKEYSLLEYLLRNANKILTKSSVRITL